MNRPCPYPIEALLPHAAPMILLDRVTGWDEMTIETALQIRPETPFLEAGKGIAAHIAIEWMAQTCGAFVGLEARLAGQPPRIGFLLGTRNFRAKVEWFAPGANVSVCAEVKFRDGETGAFDCAARQDGEEVANATLILHQPSDVAAVLASQGVQLKS